MLARLPIEPEVVRRGDEGLLANLGNEKLAYTDEFAKLADQIVSFNNS